MTSINDPARLDTADRANAKRTVAVVMPIPNDPDWSIFEEIPEDIPIIVSDDSDGRLAAPPRANVAYWDFTAQRDYLGAHYDAIPHKSAACRNFGHIVAYREGFDVIVALDYDCKTPPGWLDAHLAALTHVVDAPSLVPVRDNGWVNSLNSEGWYARGYPYELRNPVDARVESTTASGEVVLHMGLWERIVDLNGIDRFPPHEAPYGPGLYGPEPRIAQGNIPVCGMNTSFVRELTPAYFFLPDLWVEDGSPGGWQLSRHDDIWGGYIVKKLMERRGHLFSFGAPIVEHTRLTAGEKTAKIEHYMHLLARDFFPLVDTAAARVTPGEYDEMFADFTEEFMSEVGRSRAPRHYVDVYRRLGQSMQRWAAVFR
jgi:Reversibly glycosylated polypeptide